MSTSSRFSRPPEPRANARTRRDASASLPERRGRGRRSPSTRSPGGRRQGRPWGGARGTSVIALAIAALIGCRCEARHEDAPAPTDAHLPAPAPSVRQKTTRGPLALNNLDGQIEAQRRTLERRGRSLEARTTLVELLLMRTQLTGRFSDFDEVEELTETAPDEFPERARAWTLRARARGAVHRFEEALDDLKRADALGAKDAAIQRASIEMALGRNLQGVRDAARALAEQHRDFISLGRWAAAEAALGHHEQADALYAEALSTYRNVSPFPVAIVTFQRALMWAEMAGKPERALPLYVEAVRRLPEYVVANVHLAELEAETGHAEAAIRRLQLIAEHTEDPEAAGHLGELLLAREGERRAAEGYIEQARARYEALLARHRAAFLDHAAEFFAGPGADPRRAVALAEENLKLRPTGRAHLLAIDTALAAGDRALACRRMQEARDAAERHPVLHRRLEEQQPRCPH